MAQGVPLVNSEYLLQKFPGKGGWTYAAIPEVPQNKNNPFGWVKVNGTINDFELIKYKLMPMGNGSLFLPVKAEIRKIIKKQAGDYVRVLLYADESVLKVPDEIIECFKNEPKVVYENFQNFTEGEQKTYLEWINSAKTDETKADRIIKMMDRLQNNLRYAVKKEK
jgi:hypothetical protein